MSINQCKETYPYSILASAIDNPVHGKGIYEHVTFALQFDRRYMPLSQSHLWTYINLSIHISMNMSTLLSASSPVLRASLWNGKGQMNSLKLLSVSCDAAFFSCLIINDRLRGLTCRLGQHCCDNCWPKPIELHINAAKEVLLSRGLLVNGSADVLCCFFDIFCSNLFVPTWSRAPVILIKQT